MDCFGFNQKYIFVSFYKINHHVYIEIKKLRTVVTLLHFFISNIFLKMRK